MLLNILNTELKRAAPSYLPNELNRTQHIPYKLINQNFQIHLIFWTPLYIYRINELKGQLGIEVKCRTKLQTEVWRDWGERTWKMGTVKGSQQMEQSNTSGSIKNIGTEPPPFVFRVLEQDVTDHSAFLVAPSGTCWCISWIRCRFLWSNSSVSVCSLSESKASRGSFWWG